MENNENSKNMMNLNKKVVSIDIPKQKNVNRSTESRKNVLNSCDAFKSKSCADHRSDKHCKSEDVLQVIDGMKARIHQLLDETNQLKYQNNELRKQLFNP